MGYSAQFVEDETWMALQAQYRTHGNGPEFWDAYQKILENSARQGGSKVELANRMAAMAQRLGAVSSAQVIRSEPAGKR
ncbi:hypothetical protein [[Pseudomonas] boreopolis]|uniref:hypothetical protein n=1 Tax=Xanthomonas boreopolis TaxID=86183 RepID=UPI003DA1C64E